MEDPGSNVGSHYRTEDNHDGDEASGPVRPVESRSAGKLLERVRELRERARSRPGSRLVYRVVVGLCGLLVTLAGLVLVPLPGPGWLVVFLGLAILASEFSWARHLLVAVRARVHAWTHWVGRQGRVVKLALGAVTATVISVTFYVVVVRLGWPRWLSESLPLDHLPG